MTAAPLLPRATLYERTHSRSSRAVRELTRGQTCVDHLRRLLVGARLLGRSHSVCFGTRFDSQFIDYIINVIIHWNPTIIFRELMQIIDQKGVSKNVMTLDTFNRKSCDLLALILSDWLAYS